MPKVTRKDTSQPLQEVSAMVVDDEELPIKPNFSALSAQEQQKGKVEFRRVSGPAYCCSTWLFLCNAFSSVFMQAVACAHAVHELGSICCCGSSRTDQPLLSSLRCPLRAQERMLLLLFALFLSHVPCAAAAADTCPSEPHDPPEDLLAAAVHPHH
jgi:hypothetical protein